MYRSYDSEHSLRQRANFLGCDLARPHVVTLIKISHMDEHRNDDRYPPAGSGHADVPLAGALFSPSEEERLAAHKRIYGQIRRRIQDNYAGSVVYEHENLLTCL